MVREVSSRCSTAGSWQSSTALSFSIPGSLAAANRAWIARAHPHPPYRRAGSKQRGDRGGMGGEFLRTRRRAGSRFAFVETCLFLESVLAGCGSAVGNADLGQTRTAGSTVPIMSLKVPSRTAGLPSTTEEPSPCRRLLEGANAHRPKFQL